MKHDAPKLVKFKKLQRRLGLTKVRETIGLLEAMWIFCQVNAPRGDIGQFDNETIAIELEWDGDPDELIDALVEQRWLREHDEHRLVVNDWKEHAPRWVQGVASRKGGIVGNDADCSTSTIVADCSSPTKASPVADYRPPTPNLTKPNVTKPRTTGGDFCLLCKDGETFEPSDEKVSEFKRSFPDVAVEKQLLMAVQFTRDNPGTRPTFGDAAAFLSRWLARHQTTAIADAKNRAPPKPAKADPTIERNKKINGMVKTAKRRKLGQEFLERYVYGPDSEGAPIDAIEAGFRDAMRSTV